MKYGTVLHVALNNHDFRLAYKIAKSLINIKDFDPIKDFNRTDFDGNTPLHLVMRFFNNDQLYAKKMCVFLLQNGANLKIENKMQLTPLNQALYYVQNFGTSFALKYNKLVSDGGQGDHMSYPMFDFNEKGGKLEFTALHYAVKQNNFELLINLLKSNEQLDHEIEDAHDRIPIELCNSISAIFKTLRRELVKQRRRLVRKNMVNIKQQEVEFSNYHKQLLLTLNLTHTFQNSKATRMKKFRMKGEEQVSSLGNRLMSRTNSQMGGNIDSLKRKPPTSHDARIRGLKSPQSTKYQGLNDSGLGSGGIGGRNRQQQLNKSSQFLLNEGEPRTLPQAFGKKISCTELNKSQRVARQSVTNGPIQMYSDVNKNHGVKQLKIMLHDRNDPSLKNSAQKGQHNRERSADVGLKMNQQNKISIFVNNMNNSKQVASKGDKLDKSVDEEGLKRQQNASNQQPIIKMPTTAVDGKINSMRYSHQFTALNRKSSYDLSLSIKNQHRKNNFNMPRQTLQITGTPSRDFDQMHQKFKSINQIKREADKISAALNGGSKVDLSVNHISSQMNELRLGNMERYNQQQRSGTITGSKLMEAEGKAGLNGNKEGGGSNKKVWITYKQLMFKSIMQDGQQQQEGQGESADMSKDNSSQQSSDEQSSNQDDEEENLVDEDANEGNYRQVVMKSENQAGENGTVSIRRSNVAGGVFKNADAPPNPLNRPLQKNSHHTYMESSPSISAGEQSLLFQGTSVQTNQQKNNNLEFQDTDDLMKYLYDVYKLDGQQKQFQLVQEIEAALLGHKYNNDNNLQQHVETNHNICSPTINREIQKNINEKNQKMPLSQIKKNFNETAQMNMDMYDLEISDTEEQQKDINLQILDQNNRPNTLYSGLNNTQEIIPSGTAAEMHDIVDDDLDIGIEPIQNSKTQKKMQNTQIFQSPEQNSGNDKDNRSRQILINDDEEEDIDSSVSPMVQNAYQISKKSDTGISVPNRSISASDRSLSANNRSNITFPTMHVDDKPNSARMSEQSAGTPGQCVGGGLSIPNFNNNQSLQFQNNNATKNANLFERKRQTYLNHSQNTTNYGSQRAMDPDQGSSNQRQPEVKSKKKQMMKKEVEEESFDLGSGTESALLDYQIDLTTQMSMQSIRTLINLVRKLSYQSQKPAGGTGTGDSPQISNQDRLQIRQLADQVTLDVYSMRTAEACLQFQVYLDQLLRIMQRYDNIFVRSIAPDIGSAKAFLQHRVEQLKEKQGHDISLPNSRTKNVDQSIFQNRFQ